MGEPAKADPALIEDFHFLDDPAWRFGGNYLHVESNYLLLVENLLDTTHLPFLHPTTLGTDAFARSEFEVKREGDRITVARSGGAHSDVHVLTDGRLVGIRSTFRESRFSLPPVHESASCERPVSGTATRQKIACPKE